jgi:hypothetical protein
MPKFSREEMKETFGINPEIGDELLKVDFNKIAAAIDHEYKSRSREGVEELSADEYLDGRSSLMKLLVHRIAEFDDKQLLLSKEELRAVLAEDLKTMRQAERGGFNPLFAELSQELLESLQNLKKEDEKVNILRRAVGADIDAIEADLELTDGLEEYIKACQPLFESIEMEMPSELVLSHFTNALDFLADSLKVMSHLMQNSTLNEHEKHHMELTLNRIKELVDAVSFLRKVLYPQSIW